MLKYLAYILNFSPVFNISTPDTFGDYRAGETSRLSLFRIRFRGNIFFLLNVFKRKCEFIYIERLKVLRPWPNSQDIKKKASIYKDYFKTLSKDQQQRQYDYLLREADIEASSEAQLQNKITAYMSIFFVLFGFIVYHWRILLQEQSPYFSISLSLCILLLLLAINCGSDIWFFLKPHSRIRPTFSDVKKKNLGFDSFAYNAYLRWFAIKGEVGVLSNYVLNSLHSIVLIIIILILTALIPHIEVPSLSGPSNEVEVSLIDKNGALDSKNLHRFADILKAGNSSDKKFYLITNLNKDALILNKVSSAVGLFIDPTKLEIIQFEEDSSKNILLLKIQ